MYFFNDVLVLTLILWAAVFETRELFEEVPGAHSSEKIQLPQVIERSSGSRGSPNQREVEPSRVNPLVFRAKNRSTINTVGIMTKGLAFFY